MNIKEIQDQFKHASIDRLPDLIDTYGTDMRTGVKKACIAAQKKLDAFEKEKVRTFQMQEYERKYENCRYICGIDEAGRGPLAGPVVVASVIMPANSMIEGVNDSKKVSEKKREKLYDLILEEAISYGVGIIYQDEIDELNILQATKSLIEYTLH